MAVLKAYNFIEGENFVNVGDLNSYLQNYSYLNGPHPSKDDTYVQTMLGSIPNSEQYPHANRWYLHIAQFSQFVAKSFPNGKIKTPSKVEKKLPQVVNVEKKETAQASVVTPPKPQTTSASAKKPAEDDEDFDVFGDDGDDAEEASRQLMESRKKEKETKKKDEKKRIDKSSLVIEVKPYDGDVNLEKVKDMIWSISSEGVTWGEAFKKVPLAFGLYKLQVNCTIIDELVDTQGLTDKIETLGMSEKDAQEYLTKKEAGLLDDYDEDNEDDEDEDENSKGQLVQSAEIISFNKL